MKPKIVVLDYKMMSDQDWGAFHQLGECTFFDRTPSSLVVERCKEAEIAITNKVPFPRQVIEKLPKLKYIGVTATGYNMIDIEAAKERKIAVSNVPGYSTESVAQHTFALLLEIVNQVGLHSREVHEGAWGRSPDFCFWRTPLLSLQGKTMGIIGYGAIGKAVARIALAFGMNVIVHTRTPPKEKEIEWVDQTTLFQRSDVVTLHCPSSPETDRIINEKTLQLMKPRAILLNASRGSLVDEEALAQALKEKKIFAAGLDVLSQEPPNENCPLVGVSNCFITPHIAWANDQARQTLLVFVIENVRSFLQGIPKNLITK